MKKNTIYDFWVKNWIYNCSFIYSAKGQTSLIITITRGIREGTFGWIGEILSK